MSWDELIGHPHLTRRLSEAIAGDRLAHAYLFEGPKGVGKLLAARLFAQAILCRDGGGDACGQCGSCRRVHSGAHADLLWPDVPDPKSKGKDWVALSDEHALIPIDTIRRLERQIAFKPVMSAKQVTILPDADRMKGLAHQPENAFLKTLEEPPAHAVLVLTTSRSEELLPTTLSRCVRVRFGLLATDAIQRILVERHGIAEADAAELALYGAGSPGRALEASGEMVRALRRFAEERGPALTGARPEQVAAIAEQAEALVEKHAQDLDAERNLTIAAGRRVEALRLLSVLSLHLRDRMLLATAGWPGMLEPDDPPGAGRDIAPFESAFAEIARAERAIRQNVRVGLALHALFVRLWETFAVSEFPNL